MSFWLYEMSIITNSNRAWHCSSRYHCGMLWAQELYMYVLLFFLLIYGTRPSQAECHESRLTCTMKSYRLYDETEVYTWFRTPQKPMSRVRSVRPRCLIWFLNHHIKCLYTIYLTFKLAFSHNQAAPRQGHNCQQYRQQFLPLKTNVIREHVIGSQKKLVMLQFPALDKSVSVILWPLRL